MESAKFTMGQLIQFAARYYLSPEWVEEAVSYCERSWLAYQLRGDYPDEKIEGEGLERRLYITNVVEENLTVLRFLSCTHFSGVAWLEMDQDSEKRPDQRNRTLIALQGKGNMGVLLPPKTILKIVQQDDKEKLIPQQGSKPVGFDVHSWQKRGTYQRYVFFEGDDVRKEKGVPLKTPIGELCYRLGVNVEDLERSVSNLVLRVKDNQLWTPMKFEGTHFLVEPHTSVDVRSRLLEFGIGRDMAN